MTRPPTATGVLLWREMRFLGTRRRDFVARTVALLLLLLLVVVAWAYCSIGLRSLSSDYLGRLARSLSAACSGGLFVVLVLLMPAVTGGLIAKEREEGSFDLLRMTPLGTGRIVVEKCLSRVAFALHYVVLAAPFFLAPLFFGGLTFQAAVASVLFPVCAAVWMASLGIVCSALARTASNGVFGTYVAAVAWHLAVFGVAAGLAKAGAKGAAMEVAILGLPLISGIWGAVAGSAWGGREDLLWRIPLETAAFLALACLVAARIAAAERADRRPAATRGLVGPARSEVWDNALLWKEVRMGFGAGLRRSVVAALALYGGTFFGFPIALNDGYGTVWAVLAAVAGGGTFIGVYWIRGRRFLWWTGGLAAVAGAGVWVATTPEFFPTSFWNRDPRQAHVLTHLAFLMFGMYALAAVAGGAALVHERTHRTLESLRMTPLTSRDIVTGKAWGSAWSLAPAAAVWALQVLVLVVAHDFRPGGAILLVLAAAPTFILAVHLGLWVSAAGTRPGQRIGRLVGALALWAYGMPAISSICGGLLGFFSPIRWESFREFANPFYWHGQAMAWGVHRDGWVARNNEAPWLFGLVFYWAACVGGALWFRGGAARALERERVAGGS